MPGIDLGAEGTLALTVKDEGLPHREQRGDAPLHYLPADALLVDELIPDNPRIVGLGGEEIDAAFDHHSHPLLEALALHQHGAQRVLHSRERKVKDSKVDLLLGAKM